MDAPVGEAPNQVSPLRLARKRPIQHHRLRRFGVRLLDHPNQPLHRARPDGEHSGLHLRTEVHVEIDQQVMSQSHHNCSVLDGTG